MKRGVRLIAAAALLWGLIPTQIFAGAWEDSGLWLDQGVPLVNNDKTQLDIYGRAQMIGTGEIVPDPKANHDRIYLFLNEARLGVKGRYEDLFKYDIQMDMGGEDINGSNTSLSLLDMVADVPVRPLGENMILKVGQFRVPYSREGLTDEGYMDWTNQSIANMMSYQGRDEGLALMDNWGNVRGTFGTFSGGGIDIPQRYLPEQLGIPEMVARVGWDDGADVDIYHVMGTDRNLKRDTHAFYVNGLFMGDTRIGHSTALGLRTADDNLLINSNYNPYLKWGDGNTICSALTCERGSMFMVGTDGVVRHYIDDKHAAEFEYEADWGGYQNRFGVIHMASGRVQGDYQAGSFEFGLRGAALSMGNNSGFLVANSSLAGGGAKGYVTTLNPGSSGDSLINEDMGQPIWEITPSATWHVSKSNNMKVVASLPVFLDCPLWIDNADGAYVMTDPTPSGSTSLTTDEGSVLETAGNNTVRRTIPEARVMFQFQF